MTDIFFWFLTLHEKDHFVPGSGRLFGSTFVLSNPMLFGVWMPKIYTSHYDMQLTESHYLNEEGSRCIESEELADYNLCYEKYLEANMNCSLPWRQQNDTELPGGIQ